MSDAEWWKRWWLSVGVALMGLSGLIVGGEDFVFVHLAIIGVGFYLIPPAATS